MWAAIIPAAASVASSIISSQGAGDASEDMSEAEEASIAERRREFDVAQQGLSPFEKAGTDAISQLKGFGSRDPVEELNRIMSQFQESPGQRFIQKRATEAIQNQAQRLGLLDTGAERESLAQTISALASGNQQAFFKNVSGLQERRLQSLEQLFGGGERAAESLASGAIRTGEGISQDISDIGASKAAGGMAKGNILASLLGGLGGQIGGMFKGGGGVSGGGPSESSEVPASPSTGSIIGQFRQTRGGIF